MKTQVLKTPMIKGLVALSLTAALGTLGAYAQMSVERQGSQVVVSTPEFRMVFDEAAGGDVVDFFNLMEDGTAPFTDKVAQSTGAGNSGLFHIGGRTGPTMPGSPSDDVHGNSVLRVLEAHDARVRLVNELAMPNGLIVERVFTVYPSGKLYIDMRVSSDEMIWDFWDKPGGNGALYDFARASKSDRVALIADNGPGSDILDIWFDNYSVGGEAPWRSRSWLATRAEHNSSRTTAGFGSNSNDAGIAAGTWASRQLVEFLRTNIATNTNEWRRYADDYRNPALPFFSAGAGWDEDGDGYNEGEGTYTLVFPISQQLAFTFDAQGYERIRPSFKGHGFRGLDVPALDIRKSGVPLVQDLDYFAGIAPFAAAWLVEGASATQIAAGGLPGDPAESLANAADDFSLGGFGARDALYLGGATPFYGVNVDLAAGGSGALLTWEYWNGAAWTILRLDEFEAGARDFAASGTLLFDATRVPGWEPRALSSADEGVDTPRALYWIRARPSADFASAPVIREMRTDLLVVHFLGDIDESDELSFGGSPACEGSAKAVDGLVVTKDGGSLQLGWGAVSDACLDRYRVYASASRGDADLATGWTEVNDLDGDSKDTYSLIAKGAGTIESFLVTSVRFGGAEGPLKN